VAVKVNEAAEDTHRQDERLHAVCKCAHHLSAVVSVALYKHLCDALHVELKAKEDSAHDDDCVDEVDHLDVPLSVDVVILP